MTITANNIGPEVYGLFHRVSQGLQGKGKTLREEVAHADKQIATYQECLDKGGIIADGTVSPFMKGGREEYQRGLDGWKARKQKLLEGGEILIAKEERAFYLNPRDCVQTSGEPLDLMLYCHGDERLFSGRNGVYFLRDIFMHTEELREHFQQAGIAPPPLEGYRNGDQSQFVFILRGLNEPQIHFYGNRDGQTPKRHMSGFKPLGRRNLGQELAYCLDEFLRKNPNGSHGDNIGPKNVPYVIKGKRGLYEILFSVEGDPRIFTDITLEDIKQVSEK